MLRRLQRVEQRAAARVERADLQDRGLKQRRIGAAVEGRIGGGAGIQQRAQRGLALGFAFPPLPGGGFFGSRHYYTPLVK